MYNAHRWGMYEEQDGDSGIESKPKPKWVEKIENAVAFFFVAGSIIWVALYAIRSYRQ